MLLYLVGSPPPTRGKPFPAFSLPVPGGITPAYAGKTDFGYTNDPSALGSPPPTRGKLITHSVFNQGFRITPAYAGKTEVLDTDLLLFRDHPRLRGEN